MDDYIIYLMEFWLFFKFSFTLVFKDGFINLVSFGLIVKVIHDPKVNSREQGVLRMGLSPVPCTVNHSIYMISLLDPSFSFTGIPFCVKYKDTAVCEHAHTLLSIHR